MSDDATIYEAPEGEETPTSPHWLQRLFDNPWLLLLLGIVIPTLSYTVWAWIELLLTKKAELP
jgi:hypothetical protein